MKKNRYQLIIAYNGYSFSGWQWQNGQDTIQEQLETAIYKFCQERVRIHAAGRTDSKVHALSMTTHVDLIKDVPAQQLLLALNFYLNHSIVVLECKKVSEDFHARFSAEGRYYLYRILNRPVPCPFRQFRTWHISTPLNTDLMQEAMQAFIGKHDFDAFRSAHCQAKSSYKTLYDVVLNHYDDEIHLHFLAPSFLHHQIRMMVGALVFIGKEKRTTSFIKEVLNVTYTINFSSITDRNRDVLQQFWKPPLTINKDSINQLRSQLGPSAQPYGLYFVKAFYDNIPNKIPSNYIKKGMHDTSVF